MKSILRAVRKLGPGILFASMAVGTSHLVLSTKAGASYGWLMILPILLANVLKYPFFQYGVRFPKATGKSLIQGYAEQNPRFLWAYSLITLLNAISIPAALYLITGQLMGFVLEPGAAIPTWKMMAMISTVTAVLVIGRYRFLENSLKLLVAGLLAILVYAVARSVATGPTHPDLLWSLPVWGSGLAPWLFLMSLIGWMPTAVETAAWVSMWKIEKDSNENLKTSFNESLREFDTGYVLTAILALLFFFIGWWVFYGSNTVFELSGSAFSQQFATLFSSQLGEEFRLLIGLAAFATMLSSAMTAHDALGRVTVECASFLGKGMSESSKRRWIGISIVCIAAVNMAVIQWFASDMTSLITVATFISFVFAPLLGWLNLKTMTHPSVANEFRPGKVNRVWAWTGIAILGLLATGYLASLILPMISGES